MFSLITSAMLRYVIRLFKTVINTVVKQFIKQFVDKIVQWHNDKRYFLLECRVSLSVTLTWRLLVFSRHNVT